MKIGIIGYQGSGKSTLFHWLTAIAPDPALAHAGQAHLVEVPEPRVAKLCDIYQPKKISLARLEIVDTPGLSRSHEGSAARLALIREAGCLVMVVAAHGGARPAADMASLHDDLLLADLDIVSGRIERLHDQIKRPRPNRDELVAELEALQPLAAALGDGKSLHGMELSPGQQRAIKSFQLFANKPRLVVVNTAEDEQSSEKFSALAEGETELIAVSLSLQVELTQMAPDERGDFCREMQVTVADRDELIRRIMHASGQQLFFTAGDKEVRTWMVPRGATAVEGAGEIHTDLARGFIRAAVMSCDDLFRLGSEREVKAAGLMRQEPRDYVLRDGDVIEIRHNA